MTQIQLQSYGASRTVTGSRHLLHYGKKRILLDCGLFQGRRDESNERNRHIPFATDAVVLSHAHIDHSGALPSLVRSGFRGKIHATPATRDLCYSMLADCAKIAASEARYLNKRRKKKRGDPKIRPIYSMADVKRTLSQFVSHHYEEEFTVLPGIRARFRDAGHIIGSAGVLLTAKDAPSIYFTGDVGRRMYPILKDPEPLPTADVVISECTYGTRDHANARISSDELIEEVRRVFARKGKLLIPAFSVGRTQNIIYAIAQAWHEAKAPRVPVYVDSPLAEKATHVFVGHPDCYDEETESFLSEGGKPFYPKGVRYVESRDESKSLNKKKGPMIIIAGSGMCEAGRIVHHLKHGLDDPRNTVLLVGWCAPHTLGRRLIDGRNPVRVLGRMVDVRARVNKLNAYSAHAGRSDLLNFLAPARRKRSSIYLVHGEESTCMAFSKNLIDEGFRRVVVPETYARYDLAPAGATSAAAAAS